MKFTVPVMYHISGWIEIEADDYSAARTKANDLNDTGFDLELIQDRNDSSEVFVEELSGVGDE